ASGRHFLNWAGIWKTIATSISSTWMWAARSTSVTASTAKICDPKGDYMSRAFAWRLPGFAWAGRQESSGVARRAWLSTSAASGGAGAGFAGQGQTSAVAAEDDPRWKIEKGRIKQSVVHWCFNPMPLEDLACAAAELGLKSVEIVAPENWPILKKYGLICAM